MLTLDNAIEQEKLTDKITDETKHVRVRHGIYSMRKTPGVYVVRLRLPAGIMACGQMESIAEMVEKYGGNGCAHITTRQGMQILGVNGKNVAEILKGLDSQGLTTKNTGGNVVRNVVCCPLSGVSPEQIFDVTPYALAADVFLRDAKEYQNLPRKIKISFESCIQDHVRTVVSDIGLTASVRDGEEGFQITVGGGLGLFPMTGILLEEFTSLDLLFPTLEAILRVFDDYGNRSNKVQSRLKWLIKARDVGWFREFVQMERNLIKPGVPRHLYRFLRSTEEMPVHAAASKAIPLNGAYREWKDSNPKPQKQPGFFTVMVRCHRGDLKPSQLRCISLAARRFSGGNVRLTIEQNAALRWVPEASLPELYELLSSEGLAECCAEQIPDITSCVGAQACVSAITNPEGACGEISKLFRDENWWKDRSIRNLRIRVSGCHNACSHHNFADIGLFGTGKRFYGRMAPHYSILLPRSNRDGGLGVKLMDVPACKAADAVRRILMLYMKEQQCEESFGRFTERKTFSVIRDSLMDLTRVPDPQEGPEYYREPGGRSDFKIEASEGECHA